MQNRGLGWVFVVLGSLIALLALFRDPLFPGASAGFGFQQAIALLVGLAVAVVGALMVRKT